MNTVKLSKCSIHEEIHTAHVQDFRKVLMSQLYLYSPQHCCGIKNTCSADAKTWCLLRPVSAGQSEQTRLF